MMKNTVETVETLVRKVVVSENKVFVVVPSIKQFKAEVVAMMFKRPNVNRDTDKRAYDFVKDYVRVTQNLKGKHVDIQLLSEVNDKLGRDSKGHFVKL
jgi:hypothetical protein